MELVITPRTISSDNPSSVPVVFLTWLVVSYTFACTNRGSLEKHGGRFLNEAYLRRTYLQGQMHVLAKTDAKSRLFPQTFAGAVYNVCIRGCNVILGGRMYLRLK